MTLLIFVTLLGVCLAWVMGPSCARRMLPWNATEINEHYDGSGSDFIRVLRAKIDLDDFDDYANALGLTERNYLPHTDLFWPSCSRTWWDPPWSNLDVRY